MKERGSSMSQYGTMHVTGNITPEMPRILERRNGVWRRLELIAKRKRDETRRKHTDFFCIVAIYSQEFSLMGLLV